VEKKSGRQPNHHSKKQQKQFDLPYKRIEGEAAFYGPKLDFMFKDAIGRQWQLATIQLDFNLPNRFDLSYVNEQVKKNDQSLSTVLSLEV
jgi:threonyl-tRNA synthetase